MKVLSLKAEIDIASSWHIIGFVTRVTRRVSLVEQELPPVFSGVHVTRSLVFCVVFCRSLFFLVSFIVMAIALSVLFRITVSDSPMVSLNLSFFF